MSRLRATEVSVEGNNACVQSLKLGHKLECLRYSRCTNLNTVSSSCGDTGSRLVSFGGSTLRVEYTVGRAADIVEALYSNIGAGETASPRATLSLTEEPADGIFTLAREGDVRCRDHSVGAIASWLLHLTTLELAGGSTGGLLLHAGAVGRDDRAVLLPGPTGAGKTTLAAFLAAREFRYMTDELAFIADRSMTVEAFVRPLKIKTGGARALERQQRVEFRHPEMFVGPSDVLVPADAITPSLGRAALSALVFPQYQKRKRRLRVEPLTPAQAGLRLMECVLNGRALSDHGFGEVARLANSVPAYELRYSSLDQIEDHLDWLRGLSAEPQPASASRVSAAG